MTAKSLVLLFVLALATSASAEWKPRAATYGVVTQANVVVRMSDGVGLLADVHRPMNRKTQKPAAGTFPVIVTITPYRKVLPAGSASGLNRYLVERGYIHVVADVRGTGASAGVFGFFSEREQQDGPEIVRWAATVPGSNGIVGMAGASYLGITQLFTAARMGPGSPLKAILPIVASNDVYRDFAAPGGLFSAAFDAAWFLGVRPLADTFPPEDILTNPVRALGALLDHPKTLVETTVPLFTDALLSGESRYDGAYFVSRRPTDGLDDIVANGIAALLIGGWSDVFQRGEPLNYSGLQNAFAGLPVGQPMEAGQTATSRYQLVMGPWFHLAGALFPGLEELSLRWFDTWLRGEATGLESVTKPFHAFEHGTRRWVDVAEYPFAAASVETLYLREGRTGSAVSLNDGTLSTEPPAAAGSDAIDFALVANPCSRQFEQWIAGGSSAFGATTGGDSVVNPCLADDRFMQFAALTYTTEPFDEATSLAGPIGATLYVRSSTPNAELVVTVEDVAPAGTSFPLTAGYLLGSFRELDSEKSWFQDGKLVLPYHPFTKASAKPMRPGVVETVDVEVFPVLASLARGHRLRVTITTSATPYFTPVLEDYVSLLGGSYGIQRSAAHPSHVNVPLVPTASLPESDTVWGGCAGSC